MNLSINGQSQVPPGFRFHPTEEELLHYYLRKKVAFEKIDLDVIREVDLNKLEPWDIQEKCKIGSTPQNDWYFFSHKDKKYPTGTRTNRATAAGFWKATGRDKIIYSGFRRIGLRKTLVFYKGRAPHGQKSDWIMHEYRLDDTVNETSTASNPIGEAIPEEGWVVCRVFRKKNYQKSLESPKSSPGTTMDHIHSKSSQLNINNMIGSSNDGVLDQILLYMGRTCKMENESPIFPQNFNGTTNSNTNNNNAFRFLSSPNNNESMIHERFLHLPRLDSPTLSSLQFDHSHGQDRNFKSCYESYNEMLENNNNDHNGQRCSVEEQLINNKVAGATAGPAHRLNDWATLDRLVASQLNGSAALEAPNKELISCFSEPSGSNCFGLSNDDDDEDMQLSENQNRENELIWNFTKSSSSPSSSDHPLCHLSV